MTDPDPKSKIQNPKSVTLPFFVYGSLLPGQPGYSLWGEHVIHQQPAVFPNGRLYDMGLYPILVEGEVGWVQGIVVEVDPAAYAAQMTILDEYEGFDPADPEASAYRRQPRPVTLSDGRQVMAWVYLGWPDFVAGLQPIPSDDWPTYLAAKKQALLEVPETSNV